MKKSLLTLTAILFLLLSATSLKALNISPKQASELKWEKAEAVTETASELLPDVWISEPTLVRDENDKLMIASIVEVVIPKKPGPQYNLRVDLYTNGVWGGYFSMQRSVPRSNPKVTIPWQPESAYYNGMVGYLQGGQMEVELRFVVAGKKVSMKTVVRVVPYIAAVNVCGDPNNIYLEIAIAYPKGAKRTKNPTLKIYDDKGKLLHEESRRTTSTEQPLVQYTFTIARSVYEEKLRGHSTLMKLPDVEEGWQEDFSEEIGSGGC